MDMTKAFDHVDHDLLLDKLQRYGVRGNANNLIKSYLCNRQQITQVTRICPKTHCETIYCSDIKTVSCGVPQGSILGPLLFIIYINDLPKITENFMTLFADDSTILFHKNNTLTNTESDINNTLTLIINWLEYNNLRINLTKTYLMDSIQRQNALTNFDINYFNTKLNFTESTRFLGLQIDNKLNWKLHTDTLCNRLYQYSYALYKLSKIANTAAVLAAYYGHTASILRYGIIFWGNSTNKTRVFIAQKRCIRAMFGLRQVDTCRGVFRQWKILTLSSLYVFEIAMFVRTNPHCFVEYPPGSRREGTLRHHACNTALLRHSVICMAPIIYNHIPLPIRTESNLNAFKTKLTKLLEEKAYYSINEYLSDKF